ncbi:phospholipid carrier-dependent glycosyltransferase [Massilia forsythiae]|uniref:Phospholipid carrier-dependent glycosyltransferase n=1 Tax=Massilia forsythiae TaxID=2728020 RepID=A0A7Z2ZUR9_9BURK|nr:glycosyltransferase family 39 protein [Massilia forsythiae]QJE02694.1 phospholipid carrier-dependent glycosyltransferase [Massilia forsythiae]
MKPSAGRPGGMGAQPARPPAHAAAAAHPDARAWGGRLYAMASGWAAPLALALALLAGLFLRLGAPPLFDVDEGAFAEATREMLERGDAVSTWLNGQPRYDKPILVYWLQAGSVLLFGPSEFAFRLPSALAAGAWIAAILAFTRRCADRGTAWAAAFIAATTAGVTVIGRGAIADALLNLFIALAMFDIMRHAGVRYAPQRWQGQPPSPSPLSLRRALPSGPAGLPRGSACLRRAFLWMGLGLLAKGPVALLVPGGASLLACALSGRIACWRRAARDPLGWLILLAVAAPWYLLEYGRRGDAFLQGFFMRHNVERFMAPMQGHGGGALYYVPALLLVLLPYSGLFLLALRTLPAPRRRREQEAAVFLWCWFGFVFVFFSLAGTKLPHYILYGATPLFILMARRRHALCNRAPRSHALAFAPPLLLLGAVAALPELLRRAAPTIRNAYVREALGRGDVFDAAWRAGALCLLAAVLVLALWRTRPVWPRLAAAGLACACAIGALLLPALGELQQGPVKEAARLAQRAGWQVHGWRIDAPSFSVYRAAVTPAVAVPAPGQVILTRSDALDELARLRGRGAARILYRKGGVVLLHVEE